MVPKAGLEPARVSPPPPQDGVSTRFHHFGAELVQMLHESLAPTLDMAVLPGVLGCRPLRRTIKVRLETNTLRLPGGTPIFMVSRHQFTKHLDYGLYFIFPQRELQAVPLLPVLWLVGQPLSLPQALSAFLFEPPMIRWGSL
jgi:hypothetical protein